MKDELFQELLASVREGAAILRGEKEPSRTFVSVTPDVKRIRSDLGLSQNELAAMIGVSVRTVQAWEQGVRSPKGPARLLLLVAAQHPEAVSEALRSSVRQEEGAFQRASAVA
jgi:putative transcriptional regulator